MECNPFEDLALKSGRGFIVKKPSGTSLPAMAGVFLGGGQSDHNP